MTAEGAHRRSPGCRTDRPNPIIPRKDGWPHAASCQLTALIPGGVCVWFASVTRIDRSTWNPSSIASVRRRWQKAQEKTRGRVADRERLTALKGRPKPPESESRPRPAARNSGLDRLLDPFWNASLRIRVSLISLAFGLGILTLILTNRSGHAPAEPAGPIHLTSLRPAATRTVTVRPTPIEPTITLRPTATVTAVVSGPSPSKGSSLSDWAALVAAVGTAGSGLAALLVVLMARKRKEPEAAKAVG
jgi:hypothetical protein